MEKEYKVFEAEVKESNKQDLTVVHFISTERLDRGDDILYADGMTMQGKPVVLFQHGWGSSGSEPIAKPLWIKKGEFKGRKGIQAKTQFFPDELGQRLWQKTTEGYMPNWSVGWLSIRQEMKAGKAGKEVRHVYEWELLEYSLVAVPMQPDAQTMGDKKVEQIYVKMLPELEEKRGELIAWKKDDGAWEEKPYPNEHACRLEDPGKYIRIRRENDKFGKGIHAIWGVQAGSKPVELQAIRFSKDKFTVAEARAWLKAHDYKCKIFEPASEKCEKCGKPMVIKWDQDVSDEKCGETCEADFTYEHDGECEADHNEHYIEKCSDCGKIITTCRCSSPNKAIRFSICQECQKSKSEEEVDKKFAEKFFANKISKLEVDLRDLSAQVSALSEVEKKRTEKDEHQPPEPRKVVVINTEEQRQEASKQITLILSDTIGRVVKETVKEELDRLRGRVK